MIGTLLIANRGEIACRIARTCRELGIRSVVVCTAFDRDAMHVREADSAVLLEGPARAYLSREAVVAAALRCGADAVHPGYGFLAEDADFARAVQEAGLIFVGPPPEAIARMGSKLASRELCLELGVPVVPGSSSLGEAEALGWPLLIKASAGGGGKGMRRVCEPSEFEEAVAAARREAQAAFGSDEVYLEKALEGVRHLEVQVMADSHGAVLALGVRDCSVQRRHQKVLEESPPPGVPTQLLEEMSRAAVTVTRAVDYRGAGTVEFLLDGDRFYFLEMNTRIQVEHPVTEEVTGLDLVAWQLLVAEGEPLPSQVGFDGHALEARLYAEDPSRDFMPSVGPVFHAQFGDGVRVDTGIETGDRVTPYYDPMIAKLIAWGEDRPTALRRLLRALEETAVLGVVTNRDLLMGVLRDPSFQAGLFDTGFLAERAFQGDGRLEAAVAAALFLEGERGFRNNQPAVSRVRLDELEVELSGDSARVGERSFLFAQEEGRLWLDGQAWRFQVAVEAGQVWVASRQGIFRFEHRPRLVEPQPAADAGGSLRAPLPGSVVAVLVAEGDRVEAGQVLMKLEAMKMEHTICSAGPGVVQAVHFQPGDQVEADAQLVSIGE